MYTYNDAALYPQVHLLVQPHLDPGALETRQRNQYLPKYQNYGEI